MWLRKPPHLLYQQKRRFTKSTKQRNHKHPKKQSTLPKIIKPTHLTRQINQGLLQEIIYLIKVPE